jgi:alkanesulfonate monooxygenase SsuD/methylene tetrahydromethanopterin reductase-like flavin-dependent oxidoreductase (luciferase family)
VNRSVPLSAGTVALGLHLAGGDPVSAVQSLRRQAAGAESAGFDGVGLSEHHGGFPWYVPAPTLLIGALLAATEELWGAPFPTVLPLRNPTLLVEELAWLQAAFPGRVGAAFVPGYQARDFSIIGADFSRRQEDFSRLLPIVSGALSGDAPGPLGQDPAVAALASAPIPIAVGAGGPKAAARAARAGAGVILTSLADAASARGVVDAYDAAGGTGARILIRRAWLGTAPSLRAQMEAYRAEDAADELPAASPESVTLSGSPDDVLARLVEDCRTFGADALNLRVFAPDADEDAHLEQIGELGRTVLPMLRRALGWGQTGHDGREITDGDVPAR